MRSVNRGLLLVFCLLLVFLEFGVVFSFGVFFLKLLDYYQRDRAITAAVQSILIGVTLSLGVVSEAVITKLGLHWAMLLSCVLVPAGFSVSFLATRIEHLYATIGVLSGAGISLGYISTSVIIGRIFTAKERALFLAMQSASVSLSGLVYPYFIDWLIELYGLKGTFLILGAIYCNTFPLCVLCWMNRYSLNEISLSSDKTSKDKTSTKSEVSNPATNEKRNFIFNRFDAFKQVINTPYFFLILASTSSAASLNGFLVIVLEICLWKGYSYSQGLLTFVIINITITLSRLVPGIIKRRKGADSFIYPIIATIYGCVGQALLYYGTTFAVYVTGICLTGVALGGVISSPVILVLEVVHPELVPMGLGLLFTMIGVISAAMGPIFGLLRDSSGSYGTVVYTVGGIQAMAAILFALALVCRRILQKRTIHKAVKSGNIPSVSVTVTTVL